MIDRNNLLSLIYKQIYREAGGVRFHKRKWAGKWLPIYADSFNYDEDTLAKLRNVNESTRARFDQMLREHPEGIPGWKVYYPDWEEELHKVDYGMMPFPSKYGIRGIRESFEMPPAEGHYSEGTRPLRGLRYIGPGSIFHYINTDVMWDESKNAPQRSNPRVLDLDQALDIINGGLDQEKGQPFIVSAGGNIPYMVMNTKLGFRPKDPDSPQMYPADGYFETFKARGYVTADDPIFKNYDIVDLSTCATKTIQATGSSQPGYRISAQKEGMGSMDIQEKKN